MSDLWEILVPTVRKDGRPFHLRYHRLWDEQVRSLAGGLTIMPVAKGVWTDPEANIIQERVIPVRIACSEFQIKQIMGFTMAHYDQDAVFAYKVSSTCLILRKENLNGS